MILAHTESDAWWEARAVAGAKRGFVPSNHMLPVPAGSAPAVIELPAGLQLAEAIDYVFVELQSQALSQAELGSYTVLVGLTGGKVCTSDTFSPD